MELNCSPATKHTELIFRMVVVHWPELHCVKRGRCYPQNGSTSHLNFHERWTLLLYFFLLSRALSVTSVTIKLITRISRVLHRDAVNNSLTGWSGDHPHAASNNSHKSLMCAKLETLLVIRWVKAIQLLGVLSPEPLNHFPYLESSVCSWTGVLSCAFTKYNLNH